jgi:hypothetical protein
VAIITGALALHGEMPAAQIAERAEALGLDAGPQARAVLDLLDQGLVSVLRDEDGGKIIATPRLAALPRARQIAGILAYLGQARGLRHA